MITANGEVRITYDNCWHRKKEDRRGSKKHELTYFLFLHLADNYEILLGEEKQEVRISKISKTFSLPFLYINKSCIS